jgi:ATP-dependent DNA helicase DinG
VTAPLTVEGILGKGGALQAALEAYEVRPEQLTVAQAVERAFQEGSYLLAEAGTGTGKTLAYLVPAVLSGRKVVVSTATKNLQEQIFFKDIPLLRRKVGLRFRVAVLKGRQNYLCLQRLQTFPPVPPGAERYQVMEQIHDWAQKTESGDRSELDLPEQESLWRELTVTAETCLGQKCPQYEACFVTRARARAAEANIVVVNHHLFFADLSIRGRSQNEGVLPRYDAVIFDEAHALEEIASDHFGRQVSSYRVEDLVTDALRALPNSDERQGMLSALALALSGTAETLFPQMSRQLNLREGNAMRLIPGSLRAFSTASQELVSRLAALASFTAGAEEPELMSVARRASELADDWEFLFGAESDDFVYWAEQRGRGTFLRSAPIDVSGPMQRALYENIDTVVFTSATLTANGRFDFFERRMGLHRSAATGVHVEPVDDEPGTPSEQAETRSSSVRRVAVPSPFDYAEQTALYVPRHLPDPNTPGFCDAVADEVVRLLGLSRGRAFVLFTSLRNMAQVHARSRERISYPVLLQGERPKRALLEAFQAEPSVLFASHSFWEGVDVPGSALSLVVIDKLPFASPTEPVVAARIDRLRNRGVDPFGAYQLPEAAIALRQGFGRLVRSKTDTGIVALLDPRLTARAYGRVLLQGLPPARRIFDFAQLERWARGRF